MLGFYCLRWLLEHAHKLFSKSDASELSLREFSKVPLELKPCGNKNKGRGVFYSGDKGNRSCITQNAYLVELAPGKIILVSPHLGFLRFSEAASKYCAECNSNGSPDRICCSFCKKRWYCSSSCQRVNWYRLHQLECALLGTPFHLHEPQQLRSSIHLLRSYWLMLWCHRAQLDTRLWKEGTPVSGLLLDTFNSLPSHAGSSYASACLKEYEAVASLTQSELEWVFTHHPRLSSCGQVFEPTFSELVDTLKVFSSNNFSLIDSEMTAVGEATFPVGSLINHSCVPNCMYSNSFLEDFRLQQSDAGGMRATQAIIAIRPILPGEEISVSYLDVALDRKTRQAKLLGSYHFHCACDLCLQNAPSTLGIGPRDPNISIYRELVPLASHLSWRHILVSLVTPLVAKELPSLMAQVLGPWLPNAAVDTLLKLCAQACLKALADAPPKDSHPSGSLLAQATKSVIHWLNNDVHPAQISKARRESKPLPRSVPVSGHLPLPTGMDSLAVLNTDHDSLPAGWTGDLHTNVAFHQTAGRLLSSSIQLSTFQKVYANPCHPVLSLRLIELGKLWFNLGPLLAPKETNESWVLLSDFLALFYLAMAFAAVPASDNRLSWPAEIPLVADLVATTAGIFTELKAILQENA